MAHDRCWFLSLIGCALLGCALLSVSFAQAKTWPMTQEIFSDLMRDKRMVRLEVVQMTSIVLTVDERDSFTFDDLIVERVYGKHPDADCYVTLDDARRTASWPNLTNIPEILRTGELR